jgi:hypothetical protein
VPIGDEHVVAVVGTEGRFLAEVFREAGMRGARDGNGGGHDVDECTKKSKSWEDTNWQLLKRRMICALPATLAAQAHKDTSARNG